MLTIREKDVEEFIHRYVMIFSSMLIEESNWLTAKEREFFVELSFALHNNKTDLPKYFKEYTVFKGKSYYVYLSKLEKKGWVKGTSIHPNFDFIKREIPKELDFNFKLVCGTTS